MAIAVASQAEPIDMTAPLSEIRETLLERARALVPVLRDRAAETEKLRRLPEATVQDLKEAGLLRVSVPVQYGGYAGAEYDLVAEIALELARGCPSTAWCYTIWQSHNLSTSPLPEATRAEYYAAGPNVISSTARMTVREDIEIAEGGLRVSGHWKFSSGSNYASWFIVMTKGMVGLLLKREEVEVVDAWHVIGLRGTGSNDIKVENVFVPYTRVWGLFDSATANPPVWVRNSRFSDAVEGPMYAYTALSPVIGGAQGAIEAFTQHYRGTKPRPMQDDVTAESPGIQMRLSEAAAEIDAARLIMMTDCREIIAAAAASQPIPAIARARYRRNMAFASKLCIDAVNRLFDTVGGRGITEGHVLQRYYRDVLAAAHHATLPRDRLMENYGRIALGQPKITDHLGSLYHPMLMPDFFSA